jgi:cell shape-determining protein MreC
LKISNNMKKYLSTTKANSRRSTTKRWQRGFFATVVLLALAWGFPHAVSFVSYMVTYPFSKVSSWYHYSESMFPSYLRSRAELTAEIDALENKLASQASTHLTVQRLINENMQLRAVVEMGTSTPRTTARVIAQPTALSYDRLKIDQGSNAGIEVGAPVFVGVDTVIGVVVHVAPTYSFVELITTPGFTATAYVVGPNIFATLEGVGGGVARVKVPQGVLIEEGNIVLLPSIESGVYGEIVSVENVPTQPEQYGYVTPPVPLQSLLYVSVGQGAGPKQSESAIDASVSKAVQEYFRLDTLPDLPSVTSTTEPVASGTDQETQ